MDSYLIDELLEQEIQKEKHELRTQRREEIEKRYWFKLHLIKIKLTECLLRRAEKKIREVIISSPKLKKMLYAKGLKSERGLIITTFRTSGRLNSLHSKCRVILRLAKGRPILEVERIYHSRGESLHIFSVKSNDPTYRLDKLEDMERHYASEILKQLTKTLGVIHLLYKATTR